MCRERKMACNAEEVSVRWEESTRKRGNPYVYIFHAKMIINDKLASYMLADNIVAKHQLSLSFVINHRAQVGVMERRTCASERASKQASERKQVAMLNENYVIELDLALCAALIHHKLVSSEILLYPEREWADEWMFCHAINIL